MSNFSHNLKLAIAQEGFHGSRVATAHQISFWLMQMILAVKCHGMVMDYPSPSYCQKPPQTAICPHPMATNKVTTNKDLAFPYVWSYGPPTPHLLHFTTTRHNKRKTFYHTASRFSEHLTSYYSLTSFSANSTQSKVLNCHFNLPVMKSDFPV